jgi:hypothetical protein
MFDECLLELINKGIRVTSLFNSSIFCHQFELEDWPAIHKNSKPFSVPYNGSMFQLQDKYKEVFGFLKEEKDTN